MTAESGILLGLPSLKGEEQTELAQGVGALGLGGRDPLVLLARELLFRVCELTSNINADPELTIETYKYFLKTPETLSQHRFGSGTAPQAASLPLYLLPEEPKKEEEEYDDDYIEDEEGKDADEDSGDGTGDSGAE